MDEEKPATTAPERSPLAEETDAAGARAGWRSSIEAALLITAAVGIWLVVSAFALPYTKPAVPVIWGVVVLLLAALRLGAAIRSATLALVTAATGVLIVITAFVLGDSPGPTANMALMGLAVVILQAAGISAGTERTSHS
jgi:hypothetical protein